MPALPGTRFFYRIDNGETDAAALAATDWTEDVDGTFTGTDGEDYMAVAIGTSSIARNVNDITPAISGLQDLNTSYASVIAINAAASATGTNLVYSLTGPAWLSINSSTGQITGTAPSSDVSTTATVTVRNAAGSASDGFAVNVTDAIILEGPPVVTSQTIVADGEITGTHSYTPTADTVHALIYITHFNAFEHQVTVDGVPATRLPGIVADRVQDNVTPDTEGVTQSALFLADISGTSARDIVVTLPEVITGQTAVGFMGVVDIAGLTIRSVTSIADYDRRPTSDSASKSASVSVDIAENDLLVDAVISNGNSLSGSTEQFDVQLVFNTLRAELFTRAVAADATGVTRSVSRTFNQAIGINSVVFSVNETESFVCQPKEFGHVYGLTSGQTSRTVTFSGICYGNPSTVEVQVLNGEDDTEVVTWTSGTVTGGTWSCDVTVPRGGDYYIKMRRASGATEYTEITRFSVGYVVVIYGQSNAAFIDATQLETSVENSELKPFGSREGYTGWTGTSVGNRAFHIEMDVPCVTFNPAVDGLQIEALSQGTTPYDDLIDRVSNYGEPVAHICWMQGEGDAVLGQEDYALQLETLRSDIETDLGQSAGSITLHVSLLAWSTTANGTDATWADIVDELKEAASTYSNIILSHSMIDAKLQDSFHYYGEDYQRHGRRFAHSIRVDEGLETTAAPFQITSAAITTATTTTTTHTHGIGTDFTPTTGIVGFEVSNDGSTWVTATGARTDANNILWTHADIGTSARFVRYLYGKNPTGASVPGTQGNIVIDNSGLAMPLHQVTSLEAV